MALRLERGARLRRAARGRAGFVGLAVALYLTAGLAAAWPQLDRAGRDFLAGGAPGHGEAAPGNHLQAPRERPLGYSTTAPRRAVALARKLRRLNCGEFTQERLHLLRRLGVRSLVFHSGLYARNRYVRGDCRARRTSASSMRASGRSWRARTSVFSSSLGQDELEVAELVPQVAA